jgi:hypothetical protein
LLDRTICSTAGAEGLTQTLGGQPSSLSFGAATRSPATCISGAWPRWPSATAPAWSA